MDSTAQPVASRRTAPLAFVLAGGLVAGLLDIVFAWTFWAWKADVPAMRILQSVASGLLGDASFEGGVWTAMLGGALHFSIAVWMAVVYYLVAKRREVLWQSPVAFGALYGLLLYVVMNFVVVPLSAADAGSRDPTWIALSVAAHVLLIGIPIAMFTRQAMLEPQPAPT